MKIHRLLLRDFRGVPEREVLFPDSGVIVVEGANEVGKSSMIEALDLLLEEKDSATKKAVRDVRPVGRDVGSTVEAELTAGPYRFTYRKTWNRDQQTVLTVHRPAAEQLTGGQAHDRVRQILAETTDERLFKALRLLQAQPVQAGGLAESATLSAALDAAAGTAGEVAQGSPLIDAIRGEYLRYYTPTGRITGEQKTCAAAAQTARELVGEARAAVVEVAEGVSTHEQLTAELATYRVEQEAAAAEYGRRREAAQAFTKLQEQHEQAEREATRLQADATRAATEVSRRHQLAEGVRNRSAELDRLGLRSRELADAVAADQGRADLLAESVQRAQSAADQARARLDAALADVDHLQDLADLEAVVGRIESLEGGRAELAAARQQLAAHPVDVRCLAELERAATAHEQALAAQRAKAAQVTMQSVVPQEITVDGRSVSLAPGSPADYLATAAMTIDLPGQLVIRVAPAADAVAVARRAADSAAQLADLLAAAGVADLAQARAAHHEHLAARSRLQAAERSIAQVGVGAPEAELHRRRELLTRAVAGFRAACPADSPPLPDELEAARAAARQARECETEARRVAASAMADWQAQRNQDHRRQLELAGLSGEIEVRCAELDRDRAALADARTGCSDEELAGAAVIAAQRAQSAREQADQLAGRLRASDAQAIIDAAATAELKLAELATAVDRIREELIGVQARLEAYRSQGRQDVLDKALSEQQAAERRLSAVSSRARAAQLLHEVVARHRDQARADYAGPFGEQLNRLGALVFGDSFSADVDAELTVRSRTLHGRTLPFEALSTGAKEQLAILTRLAAAALVAPDDGVPVFLDDALGFADPDRLRRIGSAFLVAPGAQLILLTCSPDRYQVIPGAQVIRLDPVGRPGETATAEPRQRPAARPGRPRRTARISSPPAPESAALFEMGA